MRLVFVLTWVTVDVDVRGGGFIGREGGHGIEEYLNQKLIAFGGL